MPAKYSDSEIANMISERKRLPDDFRARVQMRRKRGHTERELEFQGEAGTRFRLILRQSAHNALDFSVILAALPPNISQPFRLRRYNGKNHEHTNQIEGVRFYDFHIHTATHRYQQVGMREDAFAEATDRYASLQEALRCMLVDCGFEVDEAALPGFRDWFPELRA